jgi:hypothetical protein
MQPEEAIRSILVTVIGAAFMFLIQPWLYQNTFMTPNDVTADVWVQTHYIHAATLTFSAAVVCQVIWYLLAIRFNTRGDDRKIQEQRVPWLILLLITLAIAGIAIYIFNVMGGTIQGTSADALLSLIGFFFVDVLLVYWLATAISTPGLLKFIPLGSVFIRRYLLKLR